MLSDKPEYSRKDVWWLVTKAIAATFVLTMIYARFLSMEEEIVLLNKKLEYFNERVDKKTSRNKDYIDKNTEEITSLKQPFSDTKTE